ncbi:MAG: aspartyl protease family protein [Flavobacteriales bacterium]
MRCTHSLLALLATVTALAQGDMIHDRNGNEIGSRQELMAGCVKEMQADRSNVMIDAERACSCVIDMLSNVESTDLEEGDEDGEALLAKMMASDSTVALAFIGCMANSMRTDVPISKFGNEAIENMIQECVGGMSAADAATSGVDALGTCRCVFEESRRKGLTLADINEMQDQNSVHFNEIMIPCVQRNMRASTSNRRVGSPDVSGKKNTDEIPLINTGNIFKAKIRIGGMERYFILDSGASDCMITTAFEQELIAKQAIRADQYLEPTDYTLADGRIVNCKRFRASSIIIGEFTVKDVIVAVVDEEGGLLLGKSFLDKFEEWTVDPRASTLYLKKQ